MIDDGHIKGMIRAHNRVLDAHHKLFVVLLHGMLSADQRID